jgi:hypothetical protein
MNSLITVCEREIKVQGRLLRIARLHGDKYRFLEEPEPVIESLRKSGARVDLFTFMQRLPQTSPKYAYPMEWDNFAALPITTFDHWWAEQIDNKTRNMARKAEKKGAVIRGTGDSGGLQRVSRSARDAKRSLRQGLCVRFSRRGNTSRQ